MATPLAPYLDARAAELLIGQRRLSERQFDQARGDSARWGTGLGETLMAQDLVTPRDWAAAMAQTTGLELADLGVLPPDPALLDPQDCRDYVALGAIPWRGTAEEIVLAVTRPAEADMLRDWAAERFPGLEITLAVTARRDILWALQRAFDGTNPALGLPPASPLRQYGQLGLALVLPPLALCLAAVAPPPALVGLTLAALAVTGLGRAWRLLLAWLGAGRAVDLEVTAAELAGLPENELPVLTLLVPLGRRGVDAALLDRLRRLRYPLAKLDIKLLMAADPDRLAAAKALRPEPIFEIVVLPESLPDSRAAICDYALRFTRGEIVVSFDPGDLPEPDQLLKAAALFRRAPASLACLQARLGGLALEPGRRAGPAVLLAALERAAWHDLLLPGLQRLGLAFPLSASSAYVRVGTLVAIGGWRPAGAIEGLGLRLIRAGHRAAIMASTTVVDGTGFRGRLRWIAAILPGPAGPPWLGRGRGWGARLLLLLPPLAWLLWAAALAGWGAVYLDAGLLPPEWLLRAVLAGLVLDVAAAMYGLMLAAARRRRLDLAPAGLLAPLGTPAQLLTASLAPGQAAPPVFTP